MKLSQLIELRRPQFDGVGAQKDLFIPLLGNKEARDLGPERIFAFAITKRGPVRKGREIYRAPLLGDPSPVEKRQAWRQAYAVWKETQERNLRSL